jgi:hypothetical protein
MSDKALQSKEERLKKFKDMGIPVPMQPVDPALSKNQNADPEKLQKLEAIRNGLKKNEFQTFIEKSTPTSPFGSIPVPKPKKNPNAPKVENVPALKSFSSDSSSLSEAALIERELYGETSSNNSSYATTNNPQSGNAPIPRIINEDTNEDPTGSKFIADFKARMRSSVIAKPISGTISKPSIEQSSERLSMTEEELDRRIVSLATQVSKNIIKKVMAESVKSGSGIIIETDRVKKVEIVGNNVVKLNGKLYKLTPVKQQQ